MTQWFLFILGNLLFEPHVLCECDLILSSPENFSFQVPRFEPGVISFTHPLTFWGDVNASQPDFVLDRNHRRPWI